VTDQIGRSCLLCSSAVVSWGKGFLGSRRIRTGAVTYVTFPYVSALRQVGNQGWHSVVIICNSQSRKTYQSRQAQRRLLLLLLTAASRENMIRMAICFFWLYSNSSHVAVAQKPHKTIKRCRVEIVARTHHVEFKKAWLDHFVGFRRA
jgi:Trp operon repressor